MDSMKPKPQPRDSFELFQAHFEQMLDPSHELIQLARKIDWTHLAPLLSAAIARTSERRRRPFA